MALQQRLLFFATMAKNLCEQRRKSDFCSQKIQAFARKKLNFSGKIENMD